MKILLVLVLGLIASAGASAAPFATCYQGYYWNQVEGDVNAKCDTTKPFSIAASGEGSLICCVPPNGGAKGPAVSCYQGYYWNQVEGDLNSKCDVTRPFSVAASGSGSLICCIPR